MFALPRAVQILGGPSSAARALRVTPQAVFFWLAGRRALSAEQCIAIERETAGAVTVEELRPDIDWAVIRGHRPGPQEAA